MNYTWDWGLLFETSIIYGDSYLWLLTISVGWTLALSLVSWLLALSAGTFVGIMRCVENKALRWFAAIYVQIFRGIPLIVQMFLWYFIVPELVPPIKQWTLSASTGTVQFVAASLCLGLFTSARITEQVRSGIESLSQGAVNSAKALGLTDFQNYRYVILPQVFRRIFPPLTSEMMNLIKNSSIAMTIGFAELTFRAREVGEITFSYFESFTIVTVVYVLIAYSANRLAHFYERRPNKLGMYRP